MFSLKWHIYIATLLPSLSNHGPLGPEAIIRAMVDNNRVTIVAYMNSQMFIQHTEDLQRLRIDEIPA